MGSVEQLTSLCYDVSKAIRNGRNNGMERIKSLNVYQKAVLIIMLALILLFSVLYPITISRVGFSYNGTILVPGKENGKTIYSGMINGKDACFIVFEDKSVVFHYGDLVYGPYTAKKDHTAIPKGKELSDSMIGVEVREGENILFRGGVLITGDSYLLYDEDWTIYGNSVTYVTSDGVERDENGDPVNRVKPTVSTIFELINEPQLTHKGTGIAWFGATFICILNAITILFADELFQISMSFRIRYTDDVEPSELEIAGRYISWTAVMIAALVIFIIGLQ